MGLSSSEDPKGMIVAWVVLTQCQPVTDGQTDGQMVRQTDGFTIADTVLCIALYHYSAMQVTHYSTRCNEWPRMTLIGYFTPNSVFIPEVIDSEGSAFKDIIA